MAVSIRYVCLGLLVSMLLLATLKVSAQTLYMSPLLLNVDGQSTLSWAKTRSSAGGGTQSQIQRHAFNLSALSQGFIWKPWFSKLTFRLQSSLDYLRSDLRSSGGAQGGRRQKADAWTVTNTFDTRLGLLPTSRMPFELGFSAVQSQSDQGSGDWRFALNLRQEFSPLARRSLLLSGGYNLSWSELERNQSVVATVSDRLGIHSLSAAFEWQEEHQEQQDGSSSYSVEGDHSFELVDRGVSVSNFATRIVSEVSANAEVIVNQFVNTTTWRPANYLGRLDYRATSRIVDSSLKTSGVDEGATQLVHASSVTYRLTSELQLSGGLGLSYVYTDEGAFSTDENVGLSYSAPEQLWGEWKRRWNATGALSFSQSEQEDRESAVASTSHQFSRDLSRGGVENRRVEFSQGVSSNLYQDRFDPTFSLSHSASLYRSTSDGEADSSWQLSASDNREIEGSGTEAQLVRIDYRHSDFSWGAGSFRSDIDLEMFRRVDAEGEESSGGSVDMLGTYQQGAVFRIPRLSYVAEARLGVLKNIKASDGEALSAIWSWNINNELRWNWGLLSLSGIMSMTGNKDVADASLRFEIRRQWRPLN